MAKITLFQPIEVGGLCSCLFLDQNGHYGHVHMARGGHRLPKVLLRPSMPDPSMPCRRAAGPYGRGYPGYPWIPQFGDSHTSSRKFTRLSRKFFRYSHKRKSWAEKLSNFAVAQSNLLVLHSTVSISNKIRLLQLSMIQLHQSW